MVPTHKVHKIVGDFPSSYGALIKDRVKFRVGRIVYLAFSRDETEMGFGFPKQERDGFVASQPDKFLMPGKADLRYNWLEARLEALELDETRELVLDAWAMCVPKSVSEAYFASEP
jgi:hypothetical protein